MDRIFKKIVGYIPLIFKALLKSYIYFFLFGFLLDLLMIPIGIFLPESMIAFVDDIYSLYGLRALFVFEFATAILKKEDKLITYKGWKEKRILEDSGFDMSIRGRSKRLDRKLDNIIKINKLYNKHILSLLNPNELLYAKSKDLLTNLNTSFNSDIDRCIKLIDISEVKNSKFTSNDKLEEVYNELDNKSNKVLNLIEGFDVNKNKHKNNKEFLYKDIESLEELIKKI